MKKKAKKFWEFKAKTETEGDLLLYGDISSEDSWWGDVVTPKQFKEDLDALGDISILNVYINSGGGDVFAGQAIYSMLKRHSAKVNVYVDGLAASIASVIAMAGDTVYMPKNAMMMIHHPMSGIWGNANEMRAMAETLDKVCESIQETYLAKASDMKSEDLVALLDAETWMTAQEAVDYGFADEIEEAKQVAASLNKGKLVMNDQVFDLSKFRNAPKLELAQPQPHNALAPGQNPSRISNSMNPSAAEETPECACMNCNHSDNCQATGAACCICGNCDMVSQCSKPGNNGCNCSECSMAQTNCCQPGESSCMCDACQNVDCKKGHMDGEQSAPASGKVNPETKMELEKAKVAAKLALECEL